MNHPLISIIISFLNPGEWLKEAVDSVIGQSYPHWELILVDDGSVASDSMIALGYAAEHPLQIKYIDHQNHRNIGLTKSRNVGINLAKGDFISFLDADDYWFPDKLEEQLKLFGTYPDAGVICEASYFWYSWNVPGETDPAVYIGAPAGRCEPGTLIKILYPLGKGQPPCPSGIILKRSVIDRLKGFEEAFSDVYQLYEDQAFLAKVYLNEVVVISAVAHNKYRKHAGSMTGAGDDPLVYAKVRNFYLDWLSGYMRDSSIVDDEITALIYNARLPVNG